ncbi:hypothetical protein [Pedobacter sp. SYP-B3415]|uniref:hypothetical protein n=1 Tax=Pedobacter sp. SYP-B3415 TaxID=2496641 RepID=UPI00101DCA3B|nr:hypothetical protein [Pedobacter sp. SYP-B3415]
MIERRMGKFHEALGTYIRSAVALNPRLSKAVSDYHRLFEICATEIRVNCRAFYENYRATHINTNLRSWAQGFAKWLTSQLIDFQLRVGFDTNIYTIIVYNRSDQVMIPLEVTLRPEHRAAFRVYADQVGIPIPKRVE